MVDTQVRPSDVTKFPIIDAMLSVPRERYVPATMQEAAYVGENVAVAPGRILFEPRTFAKMLDALAIDSADMVLYIGAGLGYGPAIVGRMAEAVVAVEPEDSLRQDAEATLSAQGEDRVAMIEAPLEVGAPSHGPYDVIIIEGGIGELPDAIADQLAEDGRIAALFVEGALGTVKIGHKHGGQISWRFGFNAMAPQLPAYQRDAAFVL